MPFVSPLKCHIVSILDELFAFILFFNKSDLLDFYVCFEISKIGGRFGLKMEIGGTKGWGYCCRCRCYLALKKDWRIFEDLLNLDLQFFVFLVLGFYGKCSIYY